SGAIRREGRGAAQPGTANHSGVRRLRRGASTARRKRQGGVLTQGNATTSGSRDTVRMVLNQQKKIRVATAALEEFLQRVQKETRTGGAEVTVCLVSDAEIARLNQEFRRKRGPTDVLSFPAEQRRRIAADAEKVL